MTDWTAGWSRSGPQAGDGIIALNGTEVLCPDDGWLHRWGAAEGALVPGSEPVYVGQDGERPVYVAQLDPGYLLYPVAPVSLRDALINRDDAPAGMLSTAAQVQQWWQDHRYCGRCGGATESHAAERARWCGRCDIPFYPRLAPCVIVVIRRGDRFLLARSSRVRNHFFSLIAGFVEPGESAEEAVAREVHEETGLRVSNVRYQGSQPWPFPHQLMLGYFADYDSGELHLQADELAEADWFAPGEHPPVPPASTIAGRLIARMEQEIRG